jgi:FkbM family methyltransferase
MQTSKTQVGFLGFLESIIRRNGILYYFIRSIVIHFNIFEEDFKILNKFYQNKKINIIDVGASDGISANFFLKNLNVKKIYCYEPHKIFIKNLMNYKKKNKNIILKKYGISHKKNKIAVYYPIVKFLGFNLPLLTYTFYDKLELKKQIKLDFYNYQKIIIDKAIINLKKYKRIKDKIDLIKIDVNGFELEVVKGMLSQIKKDRPLMVIENNSGLQKIDSLLKKYKYKKFYNKSSKFKIHKNQKVLDVFFIPQK